MSPQPLSSFHDKANLTVHLDALKERPELAALIARLINIWSMIDTKYAGLLCRFLESDFITTVAIYNSAISSSMKRDMVENAAEMALKDDPAGMELFKAVQKKIRTSSKLRNYFAHHIWCIAPKIKDSICLLNPINLNISNASLEKVKTDILQGKKSNTDVPDIEHIDNSKVMVYTKRDLEKEVDNALHAHNLVRVLVLCFYKTGPDADEVRSRARNKLTELLQ